ncbi:sorting nexin 1 [Stylonychia lemnae]|uniref:Sorting nexin 1 n=1 Tax=Stylonychia lemnae TaxID=5949 RepID=A0A078A427_STYLE|nr:sorting nexin 1 [Stylonychia lemnae]|eukprot:CDW76629.1 sorting nexin 1 [Stylonychia lemnae]
MQRVVDYSNHDQFDSFQESGNNLNQINQDNQDNQNLLGFSGFQTEIIQKYNQYQSVSVNGPKWSKEGGVGQYRLYKIETKTNQQVEFFSVYRRFRDFEWLYQILQLKFPACIIPPIPPKNAFGNWYADESEQVQIRKAGLERFLTKVMNHRLMCESDDLKGFLTEADHQFEERKRQSQQFITENSDQQQSYSSMAITTITSAFSKASEKMSGYLWSQNSPKPTARKYSFNGQNPEGQQELDRFLNNEEYLETLRESFQSLSNEILTLIDCTEESSKNYSQLSENFANFQNMKGANIDQLYTLSKEISSTFQNTSNQKKEELEDQVRKLKDPIDDYKLMIEAAISACNRRRQLVYKYYVMIEQQQKSQQSVLMQEYENSGARNQHSQLTKKIEEMFEKVKESAKILEQELKLFRQQKEVELKALISEFVNIQKKSNEKLKNYWQGFLNNSEIGKEGAAGLESQLSSLQ